VKPVVYIYKGLRLLLNKLLVLHLRYQHVLAHDKKETALVSLGATVYRHKHSFSLPYLNDRFSQLDRCCENQTPACRDRADGRTKPQADQRSLLLELGEIVYSKRPVAPSLMEYYVRLDELLEKKNRILKRLKKTERDMDNPKKYLALYFLLLAAGVAVYILA